ncbi:MAG: helix-turn-helix domain-containing protein [Candidatus Hodarchaeales archaeon]
MYNYTSSKSTEFMLAKNIKKYRKKLGLTQEALARKADVSYNTIIKLETGGIKDPRVSTIIKVANALEISIDKLVGRGKA